jgi:multiple sugar transport system ATP-binding protein
MVYVTHDQTEAMTLGDRVAVMRAGVLQQVDTPVKLYEDPDNIFVAGFIGSPAMNFIPARVDGGVIKLPMVDLRISDAKVRACGGAKQLVAGIRPEHFEDAALVGSDAKQHGATFRAKIDVLESMGSDLFAHFRVADAAVQSDALAELRADSGADTTSGEADVVARLDPASKVRQGDELEMWIDMDKILFFDAEGGAAMRADGGRSAGNGSSPGAVPAR